MTIKAETVAALAATLTAVAALAVAVWDNVQTREHYRLSVAPRLTIDMSIDMSLQRSTARIWVRNDGIGPALVEGMTIQLRDSSGQREAESWSDIAPRLREAGHSITSSWQFNPDDAIGVGQSYTLIQLEGVDGSPPLNTAINDLGFQIAYHSIYGDRDRIATFNWQE